MANERLFDDINKYLRTGEFTPRKSVFKRIRENTPEWSVDLARNPYTYIVGSWALLFSWALYINNTTPDAVKEQQRSLAEAQQEYATACASLSKPERFDICEKALRNLRMERFPQNRRMLVTNAE